MIIIKPIITEKSMKLTERGLYTFEVAKWATKPLVAKAISDRFNVKVLSVKVLNIKAKVRMQKRARKSYKVSGIKKALVQLTSGQVIPLFETPKEEEVVVTTGEGELVVREKRDILRQTKVKIEKGGNVARPTTQRKVITGK